MRSLANLKARREPAEVQFAARSKTAALAEAYEGLKEGESIKWLSGAMAPINPEYTAETITQAERVRSQLSSRLPAVGLNPEFEYQGSVTNDTHIMHYSDIDLLILHSGFTTWDTLPSTTPRYGGDVVADLVTLRKHSARAVKNAFPQAEVDESGNKSVAVKGGSLTRKIDLVAANWWNTDEYVRTQNAYHRGVHVLDLDGPKKIANKPFLHNACIDYRDKMMNGNVRKLIRLLKSLKADADRTPPITSYDIQAIVYNMDDALLTIPAGAEPLLANNCSQYMDVLERDEIRRTIIQVPNGMQRVFGPGGASLAGLKALNAELKQLLYEVQNDLTRSMRKLAEARLRY